jgi:hypothetical protein
LPCDENHKGILALKNPKTCHVFYGSIRSQIKPHKAEEDCVIDSKVAVQNLEASI